MSFFFFVDHRSVERPCSEHHHADSRLDASGAPDAHPQRAARRRAGAAWAGARETRAPHGDGTAATAERFEKKTINNFTSTNHSLFILFISTSFLIIAASFPPSSKVILLKFLLEAIIIFLPVLVLPVKDILDILW